VYYALLISVFLHGLLKTGILFISKNINEERP